MLTSRSAAMSHTLSSLPPMDFKLKKGTAPDRDILENDFSVIYNRNKIPKNRSRYEVSLVWFSQAFQFHGNELMNKESDEFQMKWIKFFIEHGQILRNCLLSVIPTFLIFSLNF